MDATTSNTPEQVSQENNELEAQRKAVAEMNHGTHAGDRMDEQKVCGTLDPTPKQYSKAEIGKLRRQHMTQVFAEVNACGHKFHPINEPTNGCDDCWNAFFRVHEGVVIGVQSIISTFGQAQLVKIRGTKFLKRYKVFAAVLEEEQRNAATEAALSEVPDANPSGE